MTTYQFDIAPDALVAALTATLPHVASSKDARDGLRGVHFETRKGSLLLVATDRYTLGVYRIADTLPRVYEDFGSGMHSTAPTEDAVEFTVALSDAKDMLRDVRAVAKLRAEVALTYDTETHAIELLTANGKMRRLALDDQFPNWYSLIEGEIQKRRDSEFVPAAGCGYNGDLLAKWGKAGDKHTPVVLHYPSNPSRPTLVTVGEAFIGICMPIRLPELSMGPGVDWLDRPNRPLATEAAA